MHNSNSLPKNSTEKDLSITAWQGLIFRFGLLFIYLDLYSFARGAKLCMVVSKRKWRARNIFNMPIENSRPLRPERFSYSFQWSMGRFHRLRFQFQFWFQWLLLDCSNLQTAEEKVLKLCYFPGFGLDWIRLDDRRMEVHSDKNSNSNLHLIIKEGSLKTDQVSVGIPLQCSIKEILHSEKMWIIFSLWKALPCRALFVSILDP